MDQYYKAKVKVEVREDVDVDPTLPKLDGFLDCVDRESKVDIGWSTPVSPKHGAKKKGSRRLLVGTGLTCGPPWAESKRSCMKSTVARVLIWPGTLMLASTAEHALLLVGPKGTGKLEPDWPVVAGKLQSHYVTSVFASTYRIQYQPNS